MIERGRILVVDDDVVLLKATLHILEVAGYETLSAQSGETALELTRAHCPDLLLLDVNMPGMDGFEVCHRIKTDPDLAGTYVILFSGSRTDSESQADGLDTGADGYITRPISNREILAHVHSILRLKTSQAALRESEARYRSLYENSPIGIYRTTPGGQILMANPALVKMLGHASFEELAMRDLAKEGYDSGVPRQEFQERIERDGEVRGFDSTWKCKDGSLIHVRENARLVRDETGQPLYYEGMVEDFTQRKQAEDALRASEAKYRLLTESMKDVVWTLDTHTLRFLYVSPSVERLRGFTPEEIIAKPIDEALVPDATGNLKELIRQRVKQTLTRQDPELKFYTEEVLQPCKDGSSIWTEVITSYHINPGNGCVEVHGVSRDISERKRSEQQLAEYSDHLEEMVAERTRELREAQEQLVRQERLASLGQLAGSVGHELRTPLSVINTAIYYLKLVQPDADGKIKHYHSMIQQEVFNADKIITDLLDFARIKSVEREPISIPELVQRVLVRFPVPPSVEVLLELPPDLPQVYADPRHIEQVLGNLTVNACQAMTAGGRMTISASTSNKQLAIAVTDTGVGILLENMSRLFEPLFTTKKSGIGLGLPVSLKLAEANGGRIEVASQPGLGTTFTLFIPVCSS